MDGKKDIPDVKAVFRGELDDIPPQESQVVRIFLSSTFTGSTSVPRPSFCPVANCY